MRELCIVIDMQEGTTKSRYHQGYLNQIWWRKHARVVSNIKKIYEKRETIFQIHTGFGAKRFLEVISDLQEKAAQSLIVYKNQDDGTDSLIPHLAPDNRLIICGMNTDACVILTARGLKKRDFTVTVVGDACWTVYADKSAWSHTHALRQLRNCGIPVIKTSALLLL
ncbi:MAG: isochorismatase family protein [Candidatus Sungbacteria bacterium]|nr:isochorismatase family protein [bacterium]MDZ4260534.1 isochorismatase family protein [Candidatus Sungbacteria bacterium]